MGLCKSKAESVERESKGWNQNVNEISTFGSFNPWRWERNREQQEQEEEIASSENRKKKSRAVRYRKKKSRAAEASTHGGESEIANRKLRDGKSQAAERWKTIIL